MKKILLVFGTRPEAIKMAPLAKRLESDQNFDSQVCITAQHRELLDPVLKMFEISPHYDLNIMTRKQDLYDITTRVLTGMKDVLDNCQPELVLVHGDTTTSFAAALAAFYRQIDVGHVEAGLRTFQIYSPYPEELNRQLTTKIARFHFAPTPLNKENLLRDGTREENVFVTGNTVIDALLMTIRRIQNDPAAERRVWEKTEAAGYPIAQIPPSRKIILVTGHRRENFGQGFQSICEAIVTIAEKYPKTDIVYPVHFNPNVRTIVNRLLSGIPNVYLMEPLDYETFVYLMNRSYLVLTDSGGIQEEAPALGKPTLVMRNTTERPEAIAALTAILVGTDREKICREVNRLLDDAHAYSRMANRKNPYGDGRAAETIARHLHNFTKRK